MRVYRLHIRPKGGLADPVRSFAYCLREHVLGVGWQVEPPAGATLTWEQYEALAIQEHGSADLSRVRFLHDHVRPDDLVWTRDMNGRYYLGRVRSPWEYFDTPDGRDADIANVVRCEIRPIPHADDVPGKIVACFRPTRAIQSIVDPTVVLYSQLLWNQLAGEDKYTVELAPHHNLFSYLDAETTEDVIFIYLQLQGWIVVPNSRKADTMAYEFVAINPASHERAVVQVKTGNTPLDASLWSSFREKVFLFQTNGIYRGASAANVVMIAPDTIEQFMRKNLEVMPRAVQRWIAYARGGTTPNELLQRTGCAGR